MLIRPATAADNEALLQLARQTPSAGPLRLYADQSPDFCAFLGVAGDGYELWVAENDGKIEGSLAETYRRVQFAGRGVNLLTLSQLRAAPTAKRAVGVTLLRHVASHPGQQARDLGVGYVLAGNDRARRLYDALLGQRFGVRSYGTVISSVLLPCRSYPLAAGYSIRTAAPADLPAIVALLQATYQDYDLAPEFDLAWLSTQLSRSATLNLDDFIVATVDGVVVASAAFWHQAGLRRHVAAVLSPTLRLLVGLLRILGHSFPAPTPAVPGVPFNLCYVRFPAVRAGHLEALGLILRHQLTVLRRHRRCHALVAGFHSSDPLGASVRGLPRYPISSEIVLAPLSAHLDLPADSSGGTRPVYTDISTT